MKLKSLLFSIFVILVFNGCLSYSISPEKLQKISKVGVISLHGNKMPSLKRGLTIFENESNVSDITSWNIDDFVQNKIVNLLNGRYSVKILELSSSKKNRIALEYEQRNDVLKELLIENQLDTIIVFENGMIVREHHDLHSGIGIIKSKVLGMESTIISLNMDLMSYEIDNEKELNRLHFNDVKPLKELDNSLWTNTSEPLTLETIKIIEPEVKQLISESLLKTLKEIGYL